MVNANSLTDKEIKNVWKKILKVLNSGEKKIIFNKDKNFKGRYLPSIGSGPDIISLNPQKDILPTLIHECLHIIFPKLSDNEIESLTQKISKEISPTCFKTLAVKLVDCFFLNS